MVREGGGIAWGKPVVKEFIAVPQGRDKQHWNTF
jgi:hypothetical protein